MFIVEYYSNDNGEWLESYELLYDYYAALEVMRLQASDHPDLPHRIVEIVRTTVALASQGEELCR